MNPRLSEEHVRKLLAVRQALQRLSGGQQVPILAFSEPWTGSCALTGVILGTKMEPDGLHG